MILVRVLGIPFRLVLATALIILCSVLEFVANIFNSSVFENSYDDAHVHTRYYEFVRDLVEWVRPKE